MGGAAAFIGRNDVSGGAGGVTSRVGGGAGDKLVNGGRGRGWSVG